ncbi:MAG: hypothetical protein JW727_03860 [Candidatus Aenigmarchaeota archaeon]|nr:hypothetical protein [Candidatus Aenigmarchaeota archaeon]
METYSIAGLVFSENSVPEPDDGVYAPPVWFSHLNELIIGEDYVQKFYRSSRSDLTQKVWSRFGSIYPQSYSSPQERKGREEEVLKTLYEAGLPVPKVISSDVDSIRMEKVPGAQLNEVYQNPKTKKETKQKLVKASGKLMREIHNTGEHHGEPLVKQFMLDYEGDDVNAAVADDKFKLYALDFELAIKAYPGFEKDIDNYIHTISAACSTGLTYRELLESYEEGYGKKIDGKLFRESFQLKIYLLARGLLQPGGACSRERFTEIYDVLYNER